MSLFLSELVINDLKRLSCKKAYLRQGVKGLCSMGGLEGSSVSSRGSDSVGFSSSSLMKNSVTSS
jgi:hypothetical protein